RIAAQLPAESVHFVTNPNLEGASPEGIVAALQSLWKDSLPDVLAAGAWANEILARFGKTFPRVQARYNVAEISQRDHEVDLRWPVFGGKVQRVARVANLGEHPLV